MIKVTTTLTIWVPEEIFDHQPQDKWYIDPTPENIAKWLIGGLHRHQGALVCYVAAGHWDEREGYDVRPLCDLGTINYEKVDQSFHDFYFSRKRKHQKYKEVKSVRNSGS